MFVSDYFWRYAKPGSGSALCEIWTCGDINQIRLQISYLISLLNCGPQFSVRIHLTTP